MKATKILIVEDEFLTANSLKKELENYTYIITDIAKNASEVFLSLAETKPDIILLDINLQGDKDGIWIASKIKENYKIPFIFLTAYTDEETVNRAILTEPNGYLAKPYNHINIHTTIQSALGNQSKKLVQKTINGDNKVTYIKENSHYIKVLLSNVIYIKSTRKKVELFLTNRVITLRNKLSEIEQILKDEGLVLFQPHRSYLVNLDYMVSFNNTHIILDGFLIPLSSKNKEMLKEHLRIKNF